MEITTGSMAALFTEYKSIFLNTVEKAPVPAVEALVQKITSSALSSNYPIAGLLGDLEEFEDETAYTNLWEYMQTIENKLYSRAVGIPIANIEDNNLGMYPGIIADLATLAATYFYRHVVYQFVSSDGTALGGQGGGFQTAWVDGANMFSNAHAWTAGAAWDNLDFLPLTATNYNTVKANLRARVNPAGRVMDLVPNLLICGPSNELAARMILNRALIGGGNTNVNENDVSIFVFNQITDLSWFLVALDGGKPIVWQERVAPQFTAQDRPDDDPAFNREEFRYKVRTRGGLGIIAPWRIQAVRWDADSSTTTAA